MRSFMKRKLMLLYIVIVASQISITAQRPSNFDRSEMRKGMSLMGVVKDKSLDIPIEYANIVIFDSKDSSQVSGGITDEDGKFKINKLRPGEFYVKVSFMGFKSTYISSIVLNRKNRTLDLGEIHIEPVSLRLTDAKVIGNKTPIEYKIDKKIINVSEQSTTISGSAVDVLENVPSVKVDIEGNVTLRGSGSFTLLIDGRPSVLDASDALEQIPASSIENIEIITNPSAKYDPEGVSGVINIISKENKLNGLSGVINANVGLNDKYGGDFTTSYKSKYYSVNLGADYNTRNHPGTSEENRKTFDDTNASFLNSFGNNSRGRTGWSIRGGADFNISQNDLFGFSLRFGDRKSERNSDINFHNYTEPQTEEKYYTSNNIRERSGKFFSSNLNYKHVFGAKQHEIYIEGMYQKRNSDESTVNEYIESDGTISSGRENIEIGPGERLRFKIDYTLPLSDKSKVEAGIQQENNKSQDDTKSFIYNPTIANYNLENEYSYIINYKRNISAIYGIYSGEAYNFGLQIGLRGEYTNREIDLVDSNSTTKINRMDYFPTIHATYKLNEIQQIMASYTSRIRRPRGWYLEPFDVWQDANNLRRGNPGLEPEYIDSYELAFMTNLGETLISLEGYHRIRNNKIESVRSVYDKDVTLRTFVNFGKDYTSGLEFMVNTAIFEFWDVNLMSDLNHYKIISENKDEEFERENNNWSVRLNNTFKLFESTKLQINSRYNGPSISSQDEYKGYFSTNIALRQELFNRMLSLTLQVRDVFDSALREGYSSGPGFESYYSFKREAPDVMLNISLKLNNYKENKKNRIEGNDDMGDEEF